MRKDEKHVGLVYALSGQQREKPAPSALKTLPANPAGAECVRWRKALRARAARDLGTRLEDQSLYCDSRKIHASKSRIFEGSGVINHIWLTPTEAAGATRSSASTGTVRKRRPWNAPSATSSAWAGMSTPRSIRWPCASIPAARSTATGKMPFRRHCRITLENLAEEPVRPSTTRSTTPFDELPEEIAYFHAQFRRVNPAALQIRLHHRRRRRGQGPVRRNLHGVGHQQQHLVGRGRDQVLHGRRRRLPRPSAAPARRTTSAARTTSRTQ